MRRLRKGVAALGLVVWFMAAPAGVLRAQTAAELINQAREYDCGYSAGPEASQPKALEIYQQALSAGPDPQQRLQILFRMAQLHSAAYLVQKDEKPDFPQAIALYERIVAAYPAQEPLVIQSMTALADCLIVARRFDDALHWSRRALDVDTKFWQDQVKALETAPDGTPSGPAPDPYPLRQTLRRIEQAQRAAVDQVANAATGLGPLWVESELRSLAQRYPGTCIEKRAQELLGRQADAVADDLAPSRHIPARPETPALHSARFVGAPAPDSDQEGLHLLAGALAGAEAGGTPAASQTAGTLRKQSPSRSPRGPPRMPVGYISTGAAGLLLVVLAARRLRRGSVRKGIRI